MAIEAVRRPGMFGTPQKSIFCILLHCACNSICNVLTLPQAIGDPGGMGWGTILLYLLRSPKVRGQLCSDLTLCLTCCGLGRRCLYRGRRPSMGTYMYKNSKRVPTVIYTQAKATPTRPPPTSHMRNLFRDRTQSVSTDSANTDSANTDS